MLKQCLFESTNAHNIHRSRLAGDIGKESRTPHREMLYRSWTDWDFVFELHDISCWWLTGPASHPFA